MRTCRTDFNWTRIVNIRGYRGAKHHQGESSLLVGGREEVVRSEVLLQDRQTTGGEEELSWTEIRPQSEHEQKEIIITVSINGSFLYFPILI